jgi:hypothetical protein
VVERKPEQQGPVANSARPSGLIERGIEVNRRRKLKIKVRDIVLGDDEETLQQQQQQEAKNDQDLITKLKVENLQPVNH